MVMMRVASMCKIECAAEAGAAVPHTDSQVASVEDRQVR